MRNSGFALLAALLLAVPAHSAPKAKARPKPKPDTEPTSCDAGLAAKRTAELEAAFKADQKDREPLEGKAPAPKDLAAYTKQVDANDFKRRKQVASIFAEGCLQTADQYYWAAMVFQHGNVPDHFLQAHIWASRADSLGSDKAYWLARASLDRYLMYSGRKQIFATQARTEVDSDPKSCFCLWPVEETAGDQLRVDNGMKTLGEQLEWVGRLNKDRGPDCQMKQCDRPAKPTPKGSVPGVSW